MEPLLVGFLVFATVLVGSLAVFRRAPEQEAVQLRLQELQQHRAPRAMVLALPFYKRALLPAVTALVQSVTRLVPPNSLAAVRLNLARAGRRHADPVVWIIVKWLRTCAAAGAAYGMGAAADWPQPVQLSAVLMFAMMGYAGAELGIRRAIARRQALILKELPETLDLLTISVEAGLGLDQAMAVVTSRRDGPLSGEIRTYLDEVRLGSDRHEALKAIGTRTGVEDLVSFTATVVQAMEFGVSVASVLRIQADAVRTRRRQRIEERAMKAPVKMLFPLIFLILPSLFVVAAGPGLIRAYTEFISPTGPGQFAPPSAPGR